MAKKKLTQEANAIGVIHIIRAIADLNARVEAIEERLRQGDAEAATFATLARTLGGNITH
jgi:hypothetical protein